MLEVTLLKVKHSGENEAKKLLPYIIRCDVYSTEDAGFCANDLKNVQEWWKNTLKMSRSAANVSFNERSTGIREIDEFGNKRYDYLHRNQKPLLAIERWNKKESDEIKSKVDTYVNTSNESFKFLLIDDLKSYFESYTFYLKQLQESVEARDKHIAQNLSKAEEWIRHENPELSKKQTLNLTIELGSGHLPENFTHIPINVINLVNLGTNFLEELTSNISNTYRIEDLTQRDILAYGMGQLAIAGIVSKITDHELRFASMEELGKILKLRRRI
ncbi:MAG: hypothetical protein ABR981_00995 [Candidatus Micrarchaeaceae archaeon]